MCSRTGAITNRGYHLEHNFGHGKEHLAALLACFNLVAFAIHTVCDLASGAWRHARETLGPRTRFFHNLQALSTYGVFSSWTELLETLAFASRKNSPGRRPACSSGPICRLLKGVWHGLADAGSEPAV